VVRWWRRADADQAGLPGQVAAGKGLTGQGASDDAPERVKRPEPISAEGRPSP